MLIYCTFVKLLTVCINVTVTTTLQTAYTFFRAPAVATPAPVVARFPLQLICYFIVCFIQVFNHRCNGHGNGVPAISVPKHSI